MLLLVSLWLYIQVLSVSRLRYSTLSVLLLSTTAPDNMSLNVSAIHNGKAQELQPQSVRALLASLVSASGVFGGTLVMYCLMRLSPKLAVVL